MNTGFLIIKQMNNTAMISVSGGRFPRARLQSPRHYVPAELSARAVPAGVATFHYNQLSDYLLFIN